MDDQYLWDRTGTPDAEVARLEEALGRLKHVPTEAPWPTKPVALEQRPRAQWLWLAGAAAVAAAIVLFLLRPDTPADTPLPVAAPAPEAPARIGEPDPPPAPRAILEESENEGKREQQRQILEKPREKQSKEVDCEADPSHPECRDLPKKLTLEQVKQGFSEVKAEATACGKEHDAVPGEKVKIKASIEGATGKVRSAVAQGPDADTKLGWCVADAAREARFPRFKKTYMGVVYPFVMSEKEEREKAGKKRRKALKNLPDKLTIEQVKKGFSRIKAKARACGPKHNAEPGTRVKVKVNIEGSTGKVRSVAPQGADANPELGWCVADAARRAQFPRFKKTQLGVVYPFVM